MADEILFSNNGVTTITSGITDSSTSISVSSGAVFESPGANEYQLLVIMPAGSSAVDLAVADIEIVKLTTRSTDTLTVTREQESTVGKAWAAGSVIAAVITKGIMEQVPQGLDPGGNAKGTFSFDLQSGRLADANVASGNYSFTLGYDNKATGNPSGAIGFTNSVTAGFAIGASNTNASSFSITFGKNNVSTGAYSLVAGNYNKVPTSDRSAGVGTTCIGNFQKNAIEDGVRIGGIPFVMLPEFPEGFANAGDVTDLRFLVGQEVTIVSHPVGIGDGPDWATAATINHGDVRFPTIPNNYTYFGYVFGTDYWLSATTHATTEPTWPTTEQDSVIDNTDITWVCIDPAEVVYLMPDYTRFIPIAVGFITDKNSGALSVNPTLRFGSATGTPADWLTAVLFDNLESPYFRQEKTVLATSPSSKILTAGVTVAGTGNCTGRFLWRGIVVETMES